MCSISWFFFAQAQDARELIKNHELNLYVSRDGLSQAVPKLTYLGEHSEVSQASQPDSCELQLSVKSVSTFRPLPELQSLPTK